MIAPHIRSFFDQATNSFTHLLHCPQTRDAAIIDPVLDFDPASGRIGTGSAQALLDAANAAGLRIVWLLETHAHADHLSAAYWLKQQTGAPIAISRAITTVQAHFAPLFGLNDALLGEGGDFDRLLDDGDTLVIGTLTLTAWSVPGHTPADMAFLVGHALFTGDTIFMPDFGSARCDFPGGDAAQLYQSVRRMFTLPDATRLFLCHDYQVAGRDHIQHEVSLGEQRRTNIHLRDGVTEAEFVTMRRARDATLPVPRLLLPALQVNIRAGRLPTDASGRQHLRIPVNAL